MGNPNPDGPGFFLRRFGHFPMLCRVDPDLDPSKT